MPPPTIAIRGAGRAAALRAARGCPAATARPRAGDAGALQELAARERRLRALPAQLGGRDAEALGGAVLLGQPSRTREAAVCVPSRPSPLPVT